MSDIADNGVFVSILMVTYNHAPYIEQAVNSILIQETDFPYEIVIGEDCSTDNTRAIAIRLQQQYPDKVRLLLHKQNLGYFGSRNFLTTLEACRGNYIAMLDGDDYWTSPHKLQLQVDFMESHPDCSLSFHGMRSVFPNAPHLPETVDRFAPGKELYSLKDVIHGHLMKTASMMFRGPVEVPVLPTRAMT